MNPRTRFSLLLAALLVLTTVLACAPKTSTPLTPETRAAYTANQVSIRVGRLQTAAIEAEKTGGLSRNDTRRIVEFSVSAQRVLQETPQGWHAIVASAWTETKRQIDPAVLAKSVPLQTAWAVVDALILSFGEEGGGDVLGAVAIPPGLINAIILQFFLPELLGFIRRRRAHTGDLPTDEEVRAESERLLAENTTKYINEGEAYLATHPAEPTPPQG